MAPPPRRRRPRRAALALAVLVLLAACGGGGGGDDDGGGASGDGDPSRTAAGVDVLLDARIEVTDAAVTIAYTATNQGDAPVAVLDLMTGEDGTFDATGWATLDAGDGTAEIAQRALPRPDDFEGVAQPTVGVTDLDPGASVDGTVTVPLPLTDHGPYADFGQEAPSDPDRVRFCLGALRDTPELPVSRSAPPEGTDGLVSHVTSYADAQAITCSDAVALP